MSTPAKVIVHADLDGMLIVPEVVPTIRGDYDLNEPRQETVGVFLASTARISPDKEMTVKAKNFAPFSTPLQSDACQRVHF